MNAATGLLRAMLACASLMIVITVAQAQDAKAPIPMPDTAEDIEFDGADGKLEFNSVSSLKAVADFYRSAIWTHALNGRFRRKADFGGFWREMARSLLTH